MTYQELKNLLAQLDDDQLACDVTIHLTQTDEYLPATGATTTDEDCDTLDSNHPIITIDF